MEVTFGEDYLILGRSFTKGSSNRTYIPYSLLKNTAFLIYLEDPDFTTFAYGAVEGWLTYKVDCEAGLLESKILEAISKL